MKSIAFVGGPRDGDTLGVPDHVREIYVPRIVAGKQVTYVYEPTGQFAGGIERYRLRGTQ